MNPSVINSGRRAVFLRELGIGPVWESRAGVPVTGTPSAHSAGSMAVVEPAIVEPASPAPIIPAAVTVTQVAGRIEPPPVEAEVPMAARVTTVSAWDDVPAVRAGSGDAPAVLAPVGVPVPAPVPVATSVLAATVMQAPDDGIADMSWQELKTAVATCTRCPLCQTRTKTVFGTGDEKARWLFVGEGPGFNEDKQGDPFIGPAGKLLDNMLLAMELKRTENTFIANVVKCRPTDANGKDRPPTAEESAACRPFLERQIALLKPAAIVALGKVAALALLGGDPKSSLGAMREQVHHYGSVPVVVTYHPAYLLRKPLDKAKSWRDLCLAAEAYANFGNLAV